ncbi:phage head spike fiber domain-containing protein [Flectobacillus longus]|uniref:phage head spike fiber domain-containing protein n=1 Tax=Flectobacillus longus TaxID=2984207 RepID=UPI0024B6A5D6|nr:hypothetical protein [Flectobacillus longus]MDI9878909.1 hypothetical protein [Flectobacillus longus]
MIKRRINIQSQLDAVNQAVAQAQASAQSAVSVSQGQATSRPTTRPSFSEDFANSRFMNPRLTLARNYLATYVDKYGKIKTAPANKPRFHHDPQTKESLGLLLEESRTNLLLYSQELTNPYFGKTGLSIIESTKKFLDGSNSFLVTEDNTNVARNFIATIQTFDAGTPLTASLFVCRASGSRHIRAELNTTNGESSVKVYFDLDSNSFTTSSVVGNGQLIGTPKVTQFDEDWIRIEFSGILDNTSTTGRLQVLMQQVPSGVAAYQGDGTSSLYITAVQVEKGLDATSVIKTNNLPVTRPTDTLTISGSLFQELFPNVSSGTLFLSARKATKRFAQTYRFYARFTGLSSSISITDHATIARVYDEIYKDSVNSYNNTLFNVDFDTYFNHAFAWKTNSAKSFMNNIEGNFDNTIDIPTTLDQLVIGNEINTIIRQIAFWPKRMSDIDLSALCVNGLTGKKSNQLPSNGDLGAMAYMSPYTILRNNGRQHFTVDGTGASITRNIRFNFDFDFEIVDSSGCSITSQPSASCLSNTDNALIFSAPQGKSLTYAIIPKFEY